jgi:hypothetical protein
MDARKEYINMCVRATEIQGAITSFSGGDFYFTAQEGTTTADSCGDPKSDGDIWLPRQDQLQGMVGENNTTRELMRVFSAWFKAFLDSPPKWFNNSTTLERLWIAFVMKERFNKEWDGEDWIKK